MQTLGLKEDSKQSWWWIPGILQARTLEWVAISFSNAWKWKVKLKSLSHVLGTGEPGGLPSMGSHRVGHNWSDLAAAEQNVIGRTWISSLVVYRILFHYKECQIYIYIGEGNGNPLQYSCLENSMDRGAWQGMVHGLQRAGHDWTTNTHTHTHTHNFYLFIYFWLY